jgi:hypothetical protein
MSILKVSSRLLEQFFIAFKVISRRLMIFAMEDSAPQRFSSVG